MAPIFVELRASIGEFKAKMGEASHEIEHLGKKGASSFDKLATVGKGALMGVTGLAVAVGGIAVHAAIEGEAAHARLAQAVKNAGGSMEEIEPRVSKLSERFAHLGFTNEEVEGALGSLTTSLRSPEKAMDSLGLAADLARYKHISLADASLTVAKAMEGQLRPLKQLGIDLPVAAGGAKAVAAAHAQLTTATAKLNTFLGIHKDALDKNSKSHGVYLQMVDKVKAAQAKVNATQGAATSITKALSDAVGGQASAASQTFAGKLEAAKAQSENLAEKLGNHLLPVIVSLVGKVSSVVTWFEHHSTTAKVLAGVVGGVLVTAITAYVVSLAMAAAESAASFAMMIAGWFGYQAAAVEATATAEASALSSFGSMIAKGALWVATSAVQVASWLATQTAAFAVWVAESIASAAASAGAVIASFATMLVGALAWAAGMLVAGAMAMLPFLPLIALVALVGIAAYELYKHWDAVWHGIQAATSAVWNWIKSHWPLILSILTGPIGAAVIYIVRHWDQVLGVVKALPGRISAAATGMWDGIKDAFRSAVNWIIDMWNGLEFRLPSIDTHIPGIGKVGGFTLGTPNLPHFKDGGRVPGPIDAPQLIVAHGGEYVISNAMQSGAQPYGGPQVAGGSGSGDGGVAEVHVSLTLDGREVHRSVQTQELRYKGRNGRSAFA